MKKIHDVQQVAFSGDFLLLQVDGKNYRFALADISPSLLAASSSVRENFEICPRLTASTGRSSMKTFPSMVFWAFSIGPPFRIARLWFDH